MRLFLLLPLLAVSLYSQVPGQTPVGIFSPGTTNPCTPVSGYSHCRVLTIDHTQVGGSTLTNYPNTVRATLGASRIQNASCFDVVFTSNSSGTTLTPWEMESCVQATGVLVAHVLSASVSSSVDTKAYISYGNSGISTAQNTGAADPTNVWDTNFLGVYHLSADPNCADSTSLSNGMTGANTPTAATGNIDGGVNFASASTQYCHNASTTMRTAAMSMSCWVNATTLPNAYNATLAQDTSIDSAFFIILVKSTGKLALYLSATGTVDYDGTGSHTLSTGTWYHVAMTYNSTVGLVGYVNGASDGTAAANGVISGLALGYETWIGNQIGFTRTWNGVLDECRVSNIVRPAGWILAEYNNQVAGSTFIAVGTEF